jgi:hypothetical protein
MDCCLPDGFGSWDEVPDRLIPATKLTTAVPSRATALRESGFVKGPLTVGWLDAIATCGHSKAIWVSLALKIQTDRRREIWVKPPYDILSVWKVNRVGLSRAISALEKAGLLEVQRRKGRPPLVRLIPWKGPGNG